MHWNNNGHVSNGKSSPNIDVTQYHVYSIEWNNQSIKWFVDGKQYLEANIANSINHTEAFHKSFFILLNLAIGGNWPGNPDESTQFPAKMYVEYVRVYQKGPSSKISSLHSIRSKGTNKYVCADNYGNNPLVANRDSVAGWEKFQVVNNNDGTISILSIVNNKYVAADLNQGTKLIARSNLVDAW